MSESRHPDPSDSILQASFSASLLEKVRASDDVAWLRLWKLLQPLVQSWCLRAGLRHSDSDDVGQEVLRALHRNIQNFDNRMPGATFRGWLWTITQNKIQDHWRKQKRTQPAEGGSEAAMKLQQVAVLDELSQSTSFQDDERKLLLRAALELIRHDIQENTWQAFWMTSVEQKTAAEVAKVLNMSTGAIYVAKSRVINRLRSELGDLLDGELKI